MQRGQIFALFIMHLGYARAAATYEWDRIVFTLGSGALRAGVQTTEECQVQHVLARLSLGFRANTEPRGEEM